MPHRGCLFREHMQVKTPTVQLSHDFATLYMHVLVVRIDVYMAYCHFGRNVPGNRERRRAYTRNYAPITPTHDILSVL